MAEVVLTQEARQQLERLPAVIHLRVLGVLERLSRWPDVSGAKSLRGDLAGHYRVRTGDYRVQFFIRGDTVVVTRMGHRDGFYDK
jgi:mRNA-degrading endonuclease RelE of RelBE toxin-antitoxin system